MKVLFIEAKKKIKEIDFKAINKRIKNFPKKLHILYTIQYKNLAEKIKKYLKRRKIRVVAFQQIVGCSRIKPQASLLLVSSGKFHALQVALSTKKPLFIYEEGKIIKLAEEEILEQEKKRKAKIAKFYSSENIGLITSIKPGQVKLKEARSLKKKLEKKFRGKNFFLFSVDNLDIKELENFSIDLWINTACPGLELDSNKIINYENLRSFQI